MSLESIAHRVYSDPEDPTARSGSTIRDLLEKVYGSSEAASQPSGMPERARDVGSEGRRLTVGKPEFVQQPSAGDVLQALPGKFAAGATEALTIDPVTFAYPPHRQSRARSHAGSCNRRQTLRPAAWQG